jgi:hypothetical protein
MIITDPAEYRIGDFVVVDGAGPAFTVLSGTLGVFDEDWKNLERKPWHTAFLSKAVYNVEDEECEHPEWWVSEAKGGVGITESRLDSFKEPYLVFRWFDTPPDAAEVKDFIDEYRGEKYDSFWGYLFVIIWYFWKWWPFIIDKNWYCWEWLWFFALRFGKPIDNVHKYPLITLLLVKIKYPGY